MGGNGRRRETSDNKPCRSRITQFSFLLPLLLPRLITVTFVCDKIFHKSKYPIVLIISSNFRENVKRNYMFLSICRISFRNFVFFSLSLSTIENIAWTTKRSKKKWGWERNPDSGDRSKLFCNFIGSFCPANCYAIKSKRARRGVNRGGGGGKGGRAEGGHCEIGGGKMSGIGKAIVRIKRWRSSALDLFISRFNLFHR